MKIIKLCTLILLSLSLSGCGLICKCEVDSFSKIANPAGKSYVLIPGNKNISPKDLQFTEFATYVARILNSKGMRYAQPSETPDLAVFLGYGISGPQTHTRSVSVPTYGQTGISSSQTFGTINTYGNSGTYSGITTYTPTYGITGYTQQTTSHTDYTRFIYIDAFDYKTFLRTKQEIQIWKTLITSTGSTNDLRRWFQSCLQLH